MNFSLNEKALYMQQISYRKCLDPNCAQVMYATLNIESARPATICWMWLLCLFGSHLISIITTPLRTCHLRPAASQRIPSAWYNVVLRTENVMGSAFVAPWPRTILMPWPFALCVRNCTMSGTAVFLKSIRGILTAFNMATILSCEGSDLTMVNSAFPTRTFDPSLNWNGPRIWPVEASFKLND